MVVVLREIGLQKVKKTQIYLKKKKLGPWLQGVKAVIAQSFERIHRSNLVGMGILPLEFKNGQNAESLGLTGKEQVHLFYFSLIYIFFFS